MTIHLRPIDLPSLRNETAEVMLKLGPTLYEQAIRAGIQNAAPRMPPSRAGAALASAEAGRLATAELFFVSGEMTALATAAGQTMPSFDLRPDDLPAPTGFIYFDAAMAHAIQAPRLDGQPAPQKAPIVAASWSHWSAPQVPWPAGGIWITWYSDTAALVAGEPGHKQAAIRSTSGRLTVDNETQCPFLTEAITPDGDPRWSTLFTLKATWLLMSQPLAAVKDAVYDRAARRRLERVGQEPPKVRVVKLRRPAGSTGAGTGDRDYHHQWIVRGHWRQQWYPARAVHRPVWIAPHVKGPEGAPMLGGDKVYAWQR